MAKADAQQQGAGGATGGITGGYAPPGQQGPAGPNPQILQALLSRFGGQVNRPAMPQGQPFQQGRMLPSQGMWNNAMPQPGMTRSPMNGGMEAPPGIQFMNKPAMPAGSASPLNPSDQSGMLNNFLQKRPAMQGQNNG